MAAVGFAFYIAGPEVSLDNSANARLGVEPAMESGFGEQVHRTRYTEPDEPRSVIEDANSAGVAPVGHEARRISYDHPVLIRNIEIRQRTLREYLPIILLEQEGPMSYGSAARAASQLAVLTQLDAEGRSQIIPEGVGARLPSPNADGYGFASGGAIYRFQRGEFPEYDLMCDLAVRFPGGIPVGELPLKQIEARVRLALSYSTD